MSNIIIPGRKVIAVEAELLVPRSRMRGWYKMEARKADGSGRKRLVADWFPNLITDVGLNRMGTAAVMSYAHVGTGNTAPDVSQSALFGWVASTTNNISSAASAGNTDMYGDYYSYRQIVWQFLPGEADAVLAEVGIGDGAANSNLFSRALILDGSGNPTTITILADEYLDVTYRLELYADFALVDGTQSNVAITGVGTRNVTLRAAIISNNTYWANAIGTAVDLTAAPLGCQAFTGSLGAITGSPSGTTDGATSVSANAYSNNSLKRSGFATFGLTDGNFTHKSLELRFDHGAYQLEFDTGIGKTSSQTMRYDYEISWGRYP